KRHMFSGFDGVISGIDDTSDNGSLYMDTKEASTDRWETASDEYAEPLTIKTRRTDSFERHVAGANTGMVLLTPPMPPSPQKRTMSISQITEKASMKAATNDNW